MRLASFCAPPPRASTLNLDGLAAARVSSATQRSGSGGGGGGEREERDALGEEYRDLVAELRRKPRSEKVIESTVPGEK